MTCCFQTGTCIFKILLLKKLKVNAISHGLITIIQNINERQNIFKSYNNGDVFRIVHVSESIAHETCVHKKYDKSTFYK